MIGVAGAHRRAGAGRSPSAVIAAAGPWHSDVMTRRSAALAGLILSFGPGFGCGEKPPTAAPAATVDGCLAAGAGDTVRDREAGEQPCCPGLARVDSFEASLLSAGKCIVSKGGRSVCVACGDATCGEGENFCNCPDDCPAP